MVRLYTALQQGKRRLCQGVPLVRRGSGLELRACQQGGRCRMSRASLACSDYRYARQHVRHSLNSSGRRGLGYGPEESGQHAANGQNETVVDLGCCQMKGRQQWSLSLASVENTGSVWREARQSIEAAPQKTEQRPPDFRNDMPRSSNGLHDYAPKASDGSWFGQATGPRGPAPTLLVGGICDVEGRRLRPRL